ncbi:MAG TPA: ester cyclase [Bryobacteraceae bacterium]|nr:ester cyclase [Bryobacteraceae bacterium]
MSEQENVQIGHQAIAALNAHDVDGYVQYLDEAYIGEAELTPGPVEGREAARQNVEARLRAFPDLRLDVEEVLATGDKVVARWRMTGTHTGEFVGIAPTNRRVEIRGCTVAQVRNGKVIRTRVYADNATMLQQLGVIALGKRATA